MIHKVWRSSKDIAFDIFWKPPPWLGSWSHLYVDPRSCIMPTNSLSEVSSFNSSDLCTSAPDIHTWKKWESRNLVIRIQNTGKGLHLNWGKKCDFWLHKFRKKCGKLASRKSNNFFQLCWYPPPPSKLYDVVWPKWSFLSALHAFTQSFNDLKQNTNIFI